MDRARTTLSIVVAAFAMCVLWVAPSGAQLPPGPREEYQGLNGLRVDRSQIYYVRELYLRRNVVRLTFTEGKLAFLTAYDGRITGAVFTGQGRVVAVPRDPVEKGSLARYLGTPLLDQPFSRAYLRFTDDSAQELLSQLRDAENKPVPDPAFADDWDATAINLNAWHSLRILTDRLSSQPQPYFYAGLASPSRGAFDVLIDPRREEQVLIGRPNWSASRAYQVWASFNPPDAERTEPALTTLAYTIQTAILPDLRLEGTATLKLKAHRDGERMVMLELSRFLRVREVADAAGRPLVFFQNEAVNQEEIGARGNDLLFVVLPESPRAGEEPALRFTYSGSVISDAGNGVYFVGERGSWYPHTVALDEFATYDLTFRWPKKLSLAATGKPVEQREEGDWRIGRWKCDVPIPVAGFNVGEYASEVVDAGSFRIELHANKQLEQALAARFQRPGTVVAGLRPQPPGSRNPSLPAQVPMVLPPPPPPSPAALLKELGQELTDSIHFYEGMIGPFPFEHLSVSPIPSAFGQGWPGLLYLSTLSFIPPSAQDRAGIARRTQEHFVELMPFHEVAHQWWGSLVGTAGYHDQWIHEGLASYLALLYADSKRPSERPLQTWLERFREDLTTKESGQEEPAGDAGPLALGTRLRSSQTPWAYERVIYGKGPWVFHMLRMMLRDPAAKNPDERFARLLRSMVESHKHRALTTDDLQAAVEKLMTPAMDLEGDKKMDWFFDQWVRGTGTPRYTVSFNAKAQGTSFLVRGTLKQAGVPDTFLAPVPLYIPRTGGKPLLLGVVEADGPETTFQFVTKIRPRKLLIDPNFTLLCLID